jgi:hypothetical protein
VGRVDGPDVGRISGAGVGWVSKVEAGGLAGRGRAGGRQRVGLGLWWAELVGGYGPSWRAGPVGLAGRWGWWAGAGWSHGGLGR